MNTHVLTRWTVSRFNTDPTELAPRYALDDSPRGFQLAEQITYLVPTRYLEQFGSVGRSTQYDTTTPW